MATTNPCYLHIARGHTPPLSPSPQVLSGTALEKSMRMHAGFTMNGSSTTLGGRWRRALPIWRWRCLCQRWRLQPRRRQLCHLLQNGVDAKMQTKPAHTSTKRALALHALRPSQRARAKRDVARRHQMSSSVNLHIAVDQRVDMLMYTRQAGGLGGPNEPRTPLP